MRVKINKIGGPFQHSYCSHPFDSPEHIEWVTDNSAEISIHMDEAIFAATDKRKINYAWLVESSAIIPELLSRLKNNILEIECKFEAIFTHDRRLLDVSPKIKWCPQLYRTWIRDKRIHRKTKLVSMIASAKTMCSGHILRQKVIECFKGKLDHFGLGFNPIQRKEEGLSEYLFSIAMENDNYELNVSEKISDCFAVGTIPIYWGPVGVKELFNLDGIIFLDGNFSLDMLTPDLYISKFEAVKENYLKTIHAPLAEDYLYDNFIKQNRI